MKNGVFFQSQEIATEGELRIQSVDDSDRVRELQDKVADLQAEVTESNFIDTNWVVLSRFTQKFQKSTRFCFILTCLPVHNIA